MRSVQASLAAVAVATVVAVPVAPVTAVPGPALTVSGVLLTSQGVPLPAGRLSLNRLDPAPDGGGEILHVVDAAVTDAYGHLTLGTDPTALAPDDLGGVTVEMVYQSAPGEPGLIYDVRATPPHSVGSEWILDVPGDSVTTANRDVPNGYDLYFQTGKGLLDALPATVSAPKPSSLLETLPSYNLNASLDSPLGEDSAVEMRRLQARRFLRPQSCQCRRVKPPARAVGQWHGPRRTTTSTTMCRLSTSVP
jgi:hypothetical protein